MQPFYRYEYNMVIYNGTPFVLFTFSIGSLFISQYNTVYFLIVLSTLLIGLLYYQQMRRNPFHVVQTIKLAITTKNNYLISSCTKNIFQRPIILFKNYWITWDRERKNDCHWIVVLVDGTRCSLRRVYVDHNIIQISRYFPLPPIIHIKPPSGGVACNLYNNFFILVRGQAQLPN